MQGQAHIVPHHAPDDGGKRNGLKRKVADLLMNGSNEMSDSLPKAEIQFGQHRQRVSVTRQSVAVCSLAQRAPSFGLWPFSLWHAALAFSFVEALVFSFGAWASAKPPRTTHRLAVAWCRHIY